MYISPRNEKCAGLSPRNEKCAVLCHRLRGVSLQLYVWYRAVRSFSDSVQLNHVQHYAARLSYNSLRFVLFFVVYGVVFLNLLQHQPCLPRVANAVIVVSCTVGTFLKPRTVKRQPDRSTESAQGNVVVSGDGTVALPGGTWDSCLLVPDGPA